MSKPTPRERLDSMVNQLSVHVKELAEEEQSHHDAVTLIVLTQAMYGLEGIMEVLRQMDERKEQASKEWLARVEEERKKL